MPRNNGIERGYEDAIPIKRSRRSEKIRTEARREAAKHKEDIKSTINRQIPRSRDTRSAIHHTDASVLRTETATAVKSVPTHAKKVPAPEKPSKHEKPSIKDDQSLTLIEQYERLEAESAAKDEPVEAEPVTEGTTPNDTPVADDEIIRIAGLRTVVRSAGVGVTPSAKKRRITAGTVVRRSLLSVFTALILAVATVYVGLYTVAVGPSETVRNTLVLSALQASATKWVPGLFLDDAVVDEILANSQKVNKDVISVEDYQNQQTPEETEDKWANAIDGMIYETVSGPTFKGYVLLVKDPSRVTVGVATDKFTDENQGMRIFEMADKYGAVAAINGGEYPDAGGMGIGGRPIGLTYSDGECVWNDGLKRSFMGFDKDNNLIVREGLTKAQADELGIRDGVCFKTGKTLITNEDGNVTMYYADNNVGTAQRTAIGQSADGTVILLVTDGRTASSLGATHNDVIDVMVSYGAISAGMLDGGSSSLMYYRDYFDKYDVDKSSLDEYQRKGLINKYKAFTTPRRLPTCFIVSPE